MAYFVMNIDIDSARKVAERALQTITFREENEKYNIWVAYINLELKFGSALSLEKVFARAISQSKGKYLFIHLAEVYEKSRDSNNAEIILEKALNKYKKSKKVWIAYQHYRLRMGDVEGAKVLLNRSIQSLSRHKHVEVISKYALAEFEVGSVERGRVIFEDLIKNFPKRTDLWHIYVDQEIKQSTHKARLLFDRMIANKFSAKNMKTIFKKLIAFESNYGDSSSLENAKEKMHKFVASYI